MPKTNKTNICGYECLLYNNKYLLPKAKIENKYLGSIKLVKYNNRFYCDIDNLVQCIFNNEYNQHNKYRQRFHKGVQNWILEYSNKNKSFTLKKELDNISIKLHKWFNNYNLIKNKMYNKLDATGKFCKSVMINIDENTYITEYYTYELIDEFIILSSKCTEQFVYNLVNNRYMLYNNVTSYNSSKKIKCIKCSKKTGLITTYYENDYEPCRCHLCEDWNGCNRGGTKNGYSKGNLIKCVNCNKEYFYDIEKK